MSFYHKKRQSQVGTFLENKSGESSQDNKSARINKIAENKKRKVDDDSFIDDETEDSDEEKSAARIIAKAKKRVDRTPKREERAPEPKIDWATGITVCQISRMRKVLVKKFKKTIMVDIREFYEDEEGALKPSRKGIALNVPQWKILIKNASKVDEAIEEMQ